MWIISLNLDRCCIIMVNVNLIGARELADVPKGIAQAERTVCPST